MTCDLGRVRDDRVIAVDYTQITTVNDGLVAVITLNRPEA